METKCTVVDNFLPLMLPLSSDNFSETNTDFQQNSSFPWNDFHSIIGENTIIVEENVIQFPKSSDLIYWVVAACGLIVIRRVVESNLLKPLGINLGIKEKIKSVAKIPCREPLAVQSLEKAYKSYSKDVSNQRILELSKQTDLTAREIERWLRQRRAVDKPSTLTKFTESGWRFICYVTSTSFGFAVLWNKTWFMDVEECWKGYPYHSITDDVWWYNTFGGSLYCSFLMTQAFDVKRKDFWEMLIHHVITIVLMGLAWTHNLFKLGMLTLLLHDCSDVFIESAKMANYSKRDNLATGIFVVFTMVWVVTRLIIFPGKIMKSCLESPHFHALPSVPRNIITGLIFFLLCLHLFWTYFIVKVAKAALSSEKTKDARSSSESESDSEIEEEGNKGKNGLAVIQNFHSRQGTQRRHSIQYENLVFDEIQATKRAFIKRLSVEWT